MAKTTADHDALRVAPGFQLEKSLRHAGEFLGEFLDGALHDAAGFKVSARKNLVELLAADVLARILAERIGVQFAQRLAPFVQKLVKGATAGAIADKAVLVLDFGIVAVDDHRRESLGPMLADRFNRLRCHRCPLCCWGSTIKTIKWLHSMG